MEAKIFDGPHDKVRAQLKEWLKANPTVQITHMTQSECDAAGLTITILYKT